MSTSLPQDYDCVADCFNLTRFSGRPCHVTEIESAIIAVRELPVDQRERPIRAVVSLAFSALSFWGYVVRTAPGTYTISSHRSKLTHEEGVELFMDWKFMRDTSGDQWDEVVEKMEKHFNNVEGSSYEDDLGEDACGG